MVELKAAVIGSGGRRETTAGRESPQGMKFTTRTRSYGDQSGVKNLEKNAPERPIHRGGDVRGQRRRLRLRDDARGEETHGDVALRLVTQRVRQRRERRERAQRLRRVVSVDQRVREVRGG